MSNITGYDFVTYSNCDIVISLLEKIVLADEDKLNYTIATDLMKQLKHECLINDIKAIIQLKEAGYITKEQIIQFASLRPELGNTTLGKAIMERIICRDTTSNVKNVE